MRWYVRDGVLCALLNPYILRFMALNNSRTIFLLSLQKGGSMFMKYGKRLESSKKEEVLWYFP